MNKVHGMQPVLFACDRLGWRGVLIVCICATLQSRVCSDTVPVSDGLTRDALQSIVERNPFGLKPPTPPPPAVETPPPEAKLNINITGIVRSRKGKLVHLVVQPEAKSATTTSPTYLSIQEGGRENGIEVLEIDEKSDKVKIRNAGVESLLSFRTHGLKSVAPAPGANPSKSGILPPGVLPQPGQKPQNTPPAGPTIISRGGVTTTTSLNTPLGGDGGSGNYGSQNSGGASATFPSGGRAIPSRTLRTQPASQAEDMNTSGHEKAVVQVIQMEAQRLTNPNIEFPPTPGAP